MDAARQSAEFVREYARAHTHTRSSVLPSSLVNIVGAFPWRDWCSYNRTYGHILFQTLSLQAWSPDVAEKWKNCRLEWLSPRKLW
jgi:hypothetical protein